MCVFEMRRGTCNESETEKFLRNRKIESCEEKTQPYGKADIQDMQKKKPTKNYCKQQRSHPKGTLHSEEAEVQSRKGTT